jgi:Lipocalin-like domain
MERQKTLSILAAAALGFASPSASALAQQSLKEQLVGTWLLVLAENVNANGSATDIFGQKGKGILIFQPNGRFAYVLVNPDVPKFASNNRAAGTPAEFEAAYKGSLASFGTYSVNDSDRTFVFHMEYNTFPNFSGSDQKRIVKSVTADELEFVSETPPIGGISKFRLRRDK